MQRPVILPLPLTVLAGAILMLTACGGGDPQTQQAAQQATQPPPPQTASTADAGRYTTWRQYQGGAHSTQFTALDQINRSNVDELQIAWTFPLGQGTMTFSPIVIGDVLYTRGPSNTVVALNAATGEQIWSTPVTGMGARGFNYWESDDGTDRRLIFLAGGMVTAMNADNGEIISSFGSEGRVDLREGLAQAGREASGPLSTSNPGRIYDDLYIISLPAQGAQYEATPGNVHAYDVRTGELQWVFHSIPHPGEHGYDTWPEGHYQTGGGVHNWAEMTVDEDRGIVFIPFGSPRFDFYGGDRHGDNLYGNSLVALNARTGERLWHFQIVRHDLWDYDLPNSPKLMTLQRDGRSVDVVAQVAKQGLVFVFDRETGEPFWPIEDQPVPQTDVPGEWTAATQPIPTLPPPFGRMTFTADDINPFLPEAEQEALRQGLANWRNDGLYTPPSFEGSVQMPGHNGGANWGSVGVDPLRGEMYVITKNLPTLVRVTLPGQQATETGLYGAVVSPEEAAELRTQAQQLLEESDEPLQLGSPYDFLRSPSTGASAATTPWAEITAYDLNTGQVKWTRPHGTVDAPAEVGLPEYAGSHLPRGGPLVTAGGLVFSATASDRMVRAYDRDTGEVVWSMDLPNGSEGVPASYEVDGRQFIVFPVASPNGLFPADFAATLETPPPASDDAAPQGAYIALALPE